MSFGTTDFPGESNYDSIFTTPLNHPGVTFVASTGDTGSPGEYPAFSPNVLGIGGTTLSIDANGNYVGESAWNGSGGGISNNEPQPTYQKGIVTQSATARTSPDVAFDANPGSGVSVYDSYNNGIVAPWVRVGGTSLSAPSWAALITIADQGRSLVGLPSLDGAKQTLPQIYALPSSDFNDITTGGNNAYPASAGYDLVTGRGSPIANLVVSGLVGLSSISGEVFNDLNGTGNLDAGDTGLPGWSVYEDLNGNGSYDPVTTTVVPATNVPVTFSPASTVGSSTLVSGLMGNVTRVTVTINVSYYRDKDLVVSLISPNNTVVTLANNNGGYSANFTNTTFDDFARAPSISTGTGPFAGTYSPSTPLWALYGSNPNGAWTLQVSNPNGALSGTINSWSLQISSGDPVATTNLSGAYQLTTPTSGTYQVGEVVLPSFIETSPSGGYYSVAVASGLAVTGVNFGNQLAMATGPAIRLDTSSVNYTNPAAWSTPSGHGEFAGGVAIASSGASMSDALSATLTSMTVTLSGATTSSGDFLIGTGNHNITVSNYLQSTGQLIFSGTDTLADYLTALKSVVYNNANTVNRSPEIVGNDYGGGQRRYCDEQYRHGHDQCQPGAGGAVERGLGEFHHDVEQRRRRGADLGRGADGGFRRVRRADRH